MPQNQIQKKKKSLSPADSFAIAAVEPLEH